jgi:uncharacterized protein
MQLTLENPDFKYLLRGTQANTVLVNDRWMTESFILSPNELIESWRPDAILDLTADDMNAVLALKPSVVILGTGQRQKFPSPAVMASCLTQGVGIEVMDNAAAARTFNVLATEGRKVVAGFLV